MSNLLGDTNGKTDSNNVSNSSEVSNNKNNSVLKDVSQASNSYKNIIKGAVPLIGRNYSKLTQKEVIDFLINVTDYEVSTIPPCKPFGGDVFLYTSGGGFSKSA